MSEDGGQAMEKLNEKDDAGQACPESEDKNLSLSLRIQYKLEKMILNGELKPSDKLNEVELSKRFGTSRGPLREAMQALQAAGLVEAVRNRGVFVRTISPEEALEFYDIRAAIFGLAGRLLTDRVNDAMLETMYGYISELDELAKVQDFSVYYHKNLTFHAYLVSSTGNSALEREYQSFVNRLHLCRMRGLVHAGGLAVSNREHAEMVNAVASGDKLRAQEAFFRHVERAKKRFRSTLEEESED